MSRFMVHSPWISLVYLVIMHKVNVGHVPCACIQGIGCVYE